MQTQTFWPIFQTWLPWALGAIGAFAFTRRLSIRSGKLLSLTGRNDTSRLRLLVFLVLLGLFAQGIDKAIWAAFTGVRVWQIGLPFLQDGVSLTQPVVFFASFDHVLIPLAWLIAYLVGFWQLMRVDLESLSDTLGFRLGFVRCLLLVVALAPIALWPLEITRAVVLFALPLVTSASAGEAYEALVKALPRPFYQVAQLTAYAFGSWLAWRLLRSYLASADGGYGKTARFGAWVLLAYGLSEGLDHLAGVLLDTLVFGKLFLEAYPEVGIDRQGGLKLVQVALPYLAFSLAADAMSALQWPAVSVRFRLPRPRLISALALLSTAALLTWPFRMPERIAELLVPLTSIGAIAAYGMAAVVTVIVWLAYQLRYWRT